MVREMSMCVLTAYKTRAPGLGSCIFLVNFHTKLFLRDSGPAFFLYMFSRNGSPDMSMCVWIAQARTKCVSQSCDRFSSSLLSYVRSPMSYVFSHMCALMCVLPYVCAHMCAFLCVLSYVCFPMCALICVLSYVCSHMCALICLLSCALICLHLCAFICASSSSSSPPLVQYLLPPSYIKVTSAVISPGALATGQPLCGQVHACRDHAVRRQCGML